MPTIAAITIPATAVNLICKVMGYAGDPSDNPAKLSFVRQYLINYLKDICRQQQRRDDIQAVALPPDEVIT